MGWPREEMGGMTLVVSGALYLRGIGMPLRRSCYVVALTGLLTWPAHWRSGRAWCYQGKAHYISVQLCTFTHCAVKDMLSSPAVLLVMLELSWVYYYTNKGCFSCQCNTVLKKTCREEAWVYIMMLLWCRFCHIPFRVHASKHRILSPSHRSSSHHFIETQFPNLENIIMSILAGILGVIEIKRWLLI